MVERNDEARQAVTKAVAQPLDTGIKTSYIFIE